MLALKNDYTLWTWGTNGNETPTQHKNFLNSAKLLHDANDSTTFPTITHSTNRSTNNISYLLYPIKTTGDSTTLDVFEDTGGSTSVASWVKLEYDSIKYISKVILQDPSRSTIPNDHPQNCEIFTSMDDVDYVSQGTIAITLTFPNTFTLEFDPVGAKYIKVTIMNNNTEGLGRFHVFGSTVPPPVTLEFDNYNKLTILGTYSATIKSADSYVFTNEVTVSQLSEKYELKTSGDTMVFAANSSGQKIELSADGNTLAYTTSFKLWIYEYKNNSWEKRYESPNLDDDGISAVALSGDGNHAAVGSWTYPSGGDQQGRVYTFSKVNGSWTRKSDIANPGGQNNFMVTFMCIRELM